MFARRAAGLAVFSAVLVLGSAAYADFSADLYFTDAGGNPVGGLLEVPDAQPTIELVLWDNQVYSGTPGADFIQWVHLNFSASDTASLNPVAHWTWDPTLLVQLEMDGGLGAANAIGRINQDATPWRPASPVRIGSLSIPTPAYVTGGDNDHLLSLKGGIAGLTETLVVDDGFVPAGIAAGSLGNLASQDLTIRVAPEPATMALLGLGAAMALLRRKRA